MTLLKYFENDTTSVARGAAWRGMARRLNNRRATSPPVPAVDLNLSLPPRAPEPIDRLRSAKEKGKQKGEQKGKGKEMEMEKEKEEEWEWEREGREFEENENNWHARPR